MSLNVNRGTANASDLRLPHTCYRTDPSIFGRFCHEGDYCIDGVAYSCGLMGDVGADGDAGGGEQLRRRVRFPGRDAPVADGPGERRSAGFGAQEHSMKNLLLLYLTLRPSDKSPRSDTSQISDALRERARRAARDLSFRVVAATGLGDDVARRELRVLLPHLRRLLRDQVRRRVDARSAGGPADGAERGAPRDDREEGDEAQHGLWRAGG